MISSEHKFPVNGHIRKPFRICVNGASLIETCYICKINDNNNNNTNNNNNNEFSFFKKIH